MTTITLDVPENLAKDIEPLRAELPALLAITRELFRPASEQAAHTSPVYRAYKQLIDFLASSPDEAALAKFSLAPAAQERAAELLDKNGEGHLTETEAAELRVYAQINQIVSLKKAQAQLTSLGA
jgi:hypothetical protein